MALQLSPIQAAGFQILRSSFEIHDLEKANTADNNINFQFSASDAVSQEDGQYGMEAVLSVASVPQDGDGGYTLDIRARGLFVGHYSEAGGTYDEFNLFMKVNAYSLLYGFVKSHAQQVTSLSPMGQVVLPCIDVQSISADLEK